MQQEHPQDDTHAQLRALYRSLVDHEERFHEFKQLLALYPTGEHVAEDADEVRDRLNARIRDWVGNEFDGLTAMQIQLWRSIVVEERFNVALSPWKEANLY